MGWEEGGAPPEPEQCAPICQAPSLAVYESHPPHTHTHAWPVRASSGFTDEGAHPRDHCRVGPKPWQAGLASSCFFPGSSEAEDRA